MRDDVQSRDTSSSSSFSFCLSSINYNSHTYMNNGEEMSPPGSGRGSRKHVGREYRSDTNSDVPYSVFLIHRLVFLLLSLTCLVIAHATTALERDVVVALSKFSRMTDLSVCTRANTHPLHESYSYREYGILRSKFGDLFGLCDPPCSANGRILARSSWLSDEGPGTCVTLGYARSSSARKVFSHDRPLHMRWWSFVAV